MDRYPYAVPYTTNPLVCGPPRIAGARTRRSIYAVEAAIGKTGPAPTQRIEWLVNGVVTSIRATSDAVFIPDYWDLILDIVKEGTQHLCSDGFTPQPLTIADLNPRIPSPDIPCWIPVRRGETWNVNAALVGIEIPPQAYQLKLTLDEFLEAPNHDLWVPNETQFYRVSQVIQPDSDGPAMEIDFQRDGVVTGWRANMRVQQPNDWFAVGFDILRNGKDHLVTNGRSAFRLRAMGASVWQGSDVFQPCWYPVNKHEKWQVFAHNFDAETEKEFAIQLRVEEFTDRGANLFAPGAYQQGIGRVQG